MTGIYETQQGGPSVLARLRQLIPDRQLGFGEGPRVAELQASRLLELTGCSDGPVLREVISELPHIRIEHRDIPTSGLCYWDGQDWVICLNRGEPATRQRFTLFHEYKHIIDHARRVLLYPGSEGSRHAEQTADYFAGCALMPRRLLKQAWGKGIQRPRDLARAFDVSERAVTVRLVQIGLAQPTERCQADSDPGSATYYRQPAPALNPALTLEMQT